MQRKTSCWIFFNFASSHLLTTTCCNLLCSSFHNTFTDIVEDTNNDTHPVNEDCPWPIISWTIPHNLPQILLCLLCSEFSTFILCSNRQLSSYNTTHRNTEKFLTNINDVLSKITKAALFQPRKWLFTHDLESSYFVYVKRRLFGGNRVETKIASSIYSASYVFASLEMEKKYFPLDGGDCCLFGGYLLYQWFFHTKVENWFWEMED